MKLYDDLESINLSNIEIKTWLFLVNPKINNYDELYYHVGANWNKKVFMRFLDDNSKLNTIDFMATGGNKEQHNLAITTFAYTLLNHMGEYIDNIVINKIMSVVFILTALPCIFSILKFLNLFNFNC